MTRDEMIARMSSYELSLWWAWFQVRAEERRRAQDIAESGDGIVYEYGRDREDDEDRDD